MLQFRSIPYLSDSSPYVESLRNLAYFCWLDSGRPQSHYGRYDIISALPSCRLVTRDHQTRLYECNAGNGSERLVSVQDSDPITLLQRQLDKLPRVRDSRVPFTGGAIGYFSYDFGKPYVRVKDTQVNNNLFADMHMGIYHWALIQDHQTKQAWIVSLGTCPEITLNTVCNAIEEIPSPDNSPPFQLKNLKPVICKAEYLAGLEKINQYILAGDCYQVNFAHCFEGEYSGDTFTAYQHLRKQLPSPHSAYLALENQSILSLSPERFIQVDNCNVTTQPIKGTSPRSADRRVDKANGEALIVSEKNRAENLMIVDLLRNDLGKHCITGSIKVDELFGLYSYPNVHHLVSSISGKLSNNRDTLELFRDSFPGGSITGAPKKRAMEIIMELENGRRGIYCGSIGFINSNGDMDMNIAIRTVSCDGQTLRCWAGGGIVADSNPEEEYQESLNKVNAILSTLESLN